MDFKSLNLFSQMSTRVPHQRHIQQMVFQINIRFFKSVAYLTKKRRVKIESSRNLNSLSRQTLFRTAQNKRVRTFYYHGSNIWTKHTSWRSMRSSRKGHNACACAIRSTQTCFAKSSTQSGCTMPTYPLRICSYQIDTKGPLLFFFCAPFLSRKNRPGG